MGLQLPRRTAGKPVTVRRMAALAAVGISVLVLGGCSSETKDEWKRLAMPDPASEQGEHILDLWQGAWIAALVTGVVVWGLIFYVVVRFRRRSDDEIPVQTRYNLPMEILYTIAPVIMVVVFFAHTVDDPERTSSTTTDPDDNASRSSASSGPGRSTTLGEKGDCEVDPDATEFPYASYVYDAGTGPADPARSTCRSTRPSRFDLHSPDVIHSFWRPRRS